MIGPMTCRSVHLPAMLAVAAVAACTCAGCRCEPRVDVPAWVDEVGPPPPPEVQDRQRRALATSTRPLVESHARVAIQPDRVLVDGQQVVAVEDGDVVYEGTPGTTWVHNVRPIWEHIDARSRVFAASEEANGRGLTWGVVTVTVHPDTPYSLLTRVLSTVGQSRLISYQFPVDGADQGGRGIRLCQVRFDSGASRCWGDYRVTLGFLPRTRGSDLDPPQEGGEEGPPSLNLMLIIRPDGFHLSSPSGLGLPPDPDAHVVRVPLRDPLPASCPNAAPSDPSPGVVPPTCAFDFDGLVREAREIKALHPAELSIVIAAVDAATWQHLASAIDAVHGEEGALLFPVIAITSGVE